MVLFTDGCVCECEMNLVVYLSLIQCEMSEDLDQYMKYTLQFTVYRVQSITVALYGHLML